VLREHGLASYYDDLVIDKSRRRFDDVFEVLSVHVRLGSRPLGQGVCALAQ
jgi:hypothetical protein